MERYEKPTEITEDDVYDLLDTLVSEGVPVELAERWGGEAERALADGLAPVRVLEAIRRKIEARRAALSGTEHVWCPDGVDIETYREQAAELATIIESLRNPAYLIGAGKTAEVFESPEIRTCYKVVTDREFYTQGHTLYREMSDFLDPLSGVEVEGVRTPKPFFVFKNDMVEALAMERLNAIALDKILENETGVRTFPPLFDPDDFFRRAERYLEALHDMHISHGDLHTGNIMVDVESGRPYIIDFGKGFAATFANEFTDEHVMRDREMLKDGKRRVVRHLLDHRS